MEQFQVLVDKNLYQSNFKYFTTFGVARNELFWEDN